MIFPASASFRINGSPTLKFKPAGSHDFIDYDGDRSSENLIAFVEEKGRQRITSHRKSRHQNRKHKPRLPNPSKGHDEL